MSYILRAYAKEIPAMFYTGGTGMNWLSYHRNEAFQFATHEAAGWKAQHFNKMEAIHGYRFVVDAYAGVA